MRRDGNGFQVLLNHPALAGRLNDLLALMLWHGKLDPRLRELAIMRIGWLTACDYEWTQHWRVAQGLGVSADDLLGVRDWQSHKGFGSAERAVLAATDDVVRDGAVSAQSWAACQYEFGAGRAGRPTVNRRRLTRQSLTHKFPRCEHGSRRCSAWNSRSARSVIAGMWWLP